MSGRRRTILVAVPVCATAAIAAGMLGVASGEGPSASARTLAVQGTGTVPIGARDDAASATPSMPGSDRGCCADGNRNPGSIDAGPASSAQPRPRLRWRAGKAILPRQRQTPPAVRAAPASPLRRAPRRRGARPSRASTRATPRRRRSRSSWTRSVVTLPPAAWMRSVACSRDEVGQRAGQHEASCPPAGPPPAVAPPPRGAARSARRSAISVAHPLVGELLVDRRGHVRADRRGVWAISSALAAEERVDRAEALGQVAAR